MNALAIRNEMNLEDLQTLGQVFVQSKFFTDTTQAAQAIVKVMAGRELGFPEIASMTGVFIIKGKVSLSANLMAAAIKKSVKYNYRLRRHDDNGCKIEFFEDGESVGFSEFTRKDAEKAGLIGGDNWKKFFRNMCFARAMSNGFKWYAPDLSAGMPVYTPDELGAVVNEEGDVIDMPVEPTIEPEPEPTTVEAEPTETDEDEDAALIEAEHAELEGQIKQFFTAAGKAENFAAWAEDKDLYNRPLQWKRDTVEKWRKQTAKGATQ